MRFLFLRKVPWNDGIFGWKECSGLFPQGEAWRYQVPESDIIRCVCQVRPQRSVGVVLVLVNDTETQSHMGILSTHGRIGCIEA